MRDLVQKLPSGNPQRDVGTSDDTIAAVLATLNEVIKKHPEFSRYVKISLFILKGQLNEIHCRSTCHSQKIEVVKDTSWVPKVRTPVSFDLKGTVAWEGFSDHSTLWNKKIRILKFLFVANRM
jgi:hypothetical protein